MTSPASGHTLVETLVGLALLLMVAAGVTTMAAVTTRLAVSHTQAFDLQQQARVALDVIVRDVRAAGAGADLIPIAGPLSVTLPAVWPRRLLTAGPAVSGDVVTLLTVPETLAQTITDEAVTPAAASVNVARAAHCPASRPACGFADGTVAGIVGAAGAVGFWRVQRVSGTRLLVQPVVGPPAGVDAGAPVVEVSVRTYEWDRPTRTLRVFDGVASGQPLIGGVEYFRVRYFTADAEVGLAALTDGPWVGGGESAFDLDLLRVRRVRVELDLSEGGQRYRTFADASVRSGREP